MSAKKSQEKAEGREFSSVSEIKPKAPAEGNAGCEWLVEELKPLEGIEREMKVIRVGPNPRMVICEYWELAERRTAVVRVGDNRKWLKGMSFKMREPLDEFEYRSVWNYRGKVPRRKGRW